MQAVRAPSRRILAWAVSNAVMQIGVNRSLATRNGRPKIPFLLFEFNKMLVMKNHHDRVSQRDSKQRDKTDYRAHRQGAAEKNKNCAPRKCACSSGLAFHFQSSIKKDH